jgi:hypothetical protein
MDFKEEIKKYNLYQLLKISADFAKQCFKCFESEGKFPRISKCNESFFIKGSYHKIGETDLLPWHLNDINYHAICLSNDFKSKNVTEYIFLDIYNSYLTYYNERAKKLLEVNEADKPFYIGFTLSQGQFWYQNTNILLRKTCRLLKLLSKNSNIKKRIENIFNVDYNTLTYCLYLLCSYSEANIFIDFPINIKSNITNKFPKINNPLINYIIEEFFQSNYDYIRKHSLKECSLIIRPIVKTTNHRKIVLSPYLFLKQISELPYRALWEKEKDEKEKKIIEQQMGELFEEYIKELLTKSIGEDNFCKIPESNKDEEKRADFFISYNGINMIVEAKFSSFNISYQMINSPLDKIDKWIKSKFVKAVKQLNNTHNELYNNQNVLKLIVFFEDIFMPEGLIKQRIKHKHNKNADVDDVYLMHINEFEILIGKIIKDENLYNQIIEEKRRRYEANGDSLEFNDIFRELHIDRNEYIENILQSLIPELYC